MTTNSPDLPRVHGYLAGNWLGCNDATPAVILNPDAQPLDLLAWCWGELESLNAAGAALAAGGASSCGDAFEPVFLHRLPSVRNVLEHVINRLCDERRADQLASQQAGDSTVRPHIVRTGGNGGNGGSGPVSANLP